MSTIELGLQDFECPSCHQEIGVGVYELGELRHMGAEGPFVPLKLVAVKVNHQCGEWSALRSAPELAPLPWPADQEADGDPDEARRNADLLARFNADVDAASEAARATGGFTTSEQ